MSEQQYQTEVMDEQRKMLDRAAEIVEMTKQDQAEHGCRDCGNCQCEGEK